MIALFGTYYSTGLLIPLFFLRAVLVGGNLSITELFFKTVSDYFRTVVAEY